MTGCGKGWRGGVAGLFAVGKTAKVVCVVEGLMRYVFFIKSQCVAVWRHRSTLHDI